MDRRVKQCFTMLWEFAFREAMQYALYSTLLALSTPLTARTIERCINSVEKGSKAEFASFFLLLMLLSLAAVLLAHCKRRASYLLNEALMRHCTPRIIDKLNHMRYSIFDDAAAADVLEQVQRNPTIALAQAYKTLINCMALVLRILGVALLFFDLSWWFGSTLIVLMVAEIAIGVISNREFGRLENAELPKERKLSYIGSLLCRKESVFDCKINQSINCLKALQETLSRQLLKERTEISLKAERYYLLNMILMLIWTVWLLIVLIQGRAADTVALGLFCTLLGSYPLLTQYQGELSYHLSAMGKSWVLIEALQVFFSFEEEANDAELPPASMEIRFEQVSFRYPGTDRYALRQISFTLSPGQKIALVGTNGSGKSTLIKLLCGLYEPTEGTVTVQGIPIHSLALSEKRKLFSAVFQDFQTYAMTVADNVGLGDIDTPENAEEITRALDQAGLREAVDALPLGMDTHLEHLEKDGTVLSGGQRQRLAIARAYLSKACFILLDEPTASIDPVAESRLYQSFVKLLDGRGAVLVSHRLASAMLADRIFVLENGEMVQQGTHAQLMEEAGPYKEMFTKQASWYLTEEFRNEP